MEEYVQRVLQARRRTVEVERSRSSIGKPQPIAITLADLIMSSSEGARVDQKLEGDCRAIFKDGHFYEGEFRDGLMHGLGKFTWTDGLHYEGEMDRSKLTGIGTYTWPDGSTYQGSVLNGIRHGSGSYYSPLTQTSYSGQWVNGKREGKGRLTYSESATSEEDEKEEEDVQGESFYDGDWVDNKQHGIGVRQYSFGNVYKGEWREGVKEGEGEMVWAGGQERYKGHWSNDHPNGHGVYIWQTVSSQNHAQHPLSNRYEGEWRDGLRHGQGSFYYANGAVYKGEWVSGVKEGHGTFTFKNGKSLTAVFHRDRVSIKDQEEEEEEEEEEVDKLCLRPKTPLGTLIGDVAGSGEREEVNEFTLSVFPLLSTLADPHSQLKQIHLLMLQNLSQLKKIYHFYSSLGLDSLQHSHTLTRLQFWQLLKDCRVHHCGLSIWKADSIAAGHQPPCPSSTLLMREFLQSLVPLSYHMYSDLISEDVSVRLSHFLNECLLPNACILTGLVFTTAKSNDPIQQHQELAWSIYQSIAHSTKEGDLFASMRDLLWHFKKQGILSDQFTAEMVVKSLVQDQPLAVDQSDYDLDIKITVLDVLETVYRCCQVMSCDQSHDLDQSKPLPLSPTQVLHQLNRCGCLN